MNIVDVIIVLMLIGAVLHGLSKGLISQIINLAAFVFALTIASVNGVAAAHTIDKFVALPEAYQPLIGFVVTFLVVEAVIRAVLRLAGHVIPGILTGSAPNRLLGVVPAVAESALFITIAITVVTHVPSWTQANTLITQSRFAPPVQQLGAATGSLVDKIIGDKLPDIPAKLPQ